MRLPHLSTVPEFHLFSIGYFGESIRTLEIESGGRMALPFSRRCSYEMRILCICMTRKGFKIKGGGLLDSRPPPFPKWLCLFPAVASDDLVGLALRHVAEPDLLFTERLDGGEKRFVRLIRAERVFFAVV